MTGPFGKLGSAATDFIDRQDKYGQQARDQNNTEVQQGVQREQLDLQRQQLKLQQDEAANRRLDTLSSGLDKVFQFANDNAKYLPPEYATGFGQMQAEWQDAYQSQLMNGDTKKMDAFRDKYRGGSLSVTRNGATEVVNVTDLYRMVQEEKPKRDEVEGIEKSFGLMAANSAGNVLNDPTATPETRAQAMSILRGTGSNYDKAQAITYLDKGLTPEKVLGQLAAKPPVTPQDFLFLRGQVEAMRARATPEQGAALDALEARYNPEKATSPAQKAAAERNATAMQEYEDAQSAEAKGAVAKLDNMLLDNQGKGLDLQKVQRTLESTINLINRSNASGMTDLDQHDLDVQIAGQMRTLKAGAERVGLMANIAKNGGQGKAYLQRVMNDPALMEMLGVSPEEVQSGIDRAGQVQSADNTDAMLKTVGATAYFQSLGFAGLDALKKQRDNGDITEERYTELTRVAGLIGQAQEAGLNTDIITNRNKTAQQNVIGETIEDDTRAQQRVNRITLSNGYMVQAYSLTGIRARLDAGVPGKEATAAASAADTAVKRDAYGNLIIDTQVAAGLPDAQTQAAVRMSENDAAAADLSVQQIEARIKAGQPVTAAQAEVARLWADTSAAKNQVLVNGVEGQYLVKLTTLEMEAAIKAARNRGVQADADGRWIISESDLTHATTVATGRATIAGQENALITSLAMRPYLKPMTINSAMDAIAGSQASTLQKQQLLQTLQAQAPYLNEAAVAQITSDIASGRATVAEANNRLTTARALAPLIPQTVQRTFAVQMAQGRYDEAFATLQAQNLKWNDLNGSLDSLGALTKVATWQQAQKMPGFMQWANRNGVNEAVYNGIKSVNDAGTPGTKEYESRRKLASTQVSQARARYESLESDTQYKNLFTQLNALSLPKTVIDTMTGRSYSASAIDATIQNGTYTDENGKQQSYTAQQKNILRQIADYKRTQLDPAWQRWGDAQDALDSFGGSAGFNTGAAGGGAASQSILNAPAGFRQRNDNAAATVNTDPRVLYGLFFAETTFGTNTANSKGKDYVGAGQVGATAEADVNASRKRAGMKPLSRSNPDENMLIAASYLKMKLAEFGGDPDKAYAAYNMGSGNLRKHLDAHGGKLVLADLPAETQTGIANLRQGMLDYDNARLGQPGAPISSGANQNLPAPGKADRMLTPGTDLTTLGITNSAIYNTKNPDGSINSFCVRFAREYTTGANGVPPTSLSGKYFGPDAKSTLNNFIRNDAITKSAMTPQQARSAVAGLAQGDMVFLDYGNPSKDHVAIYAGNGMFIQHSSPSFRGTTIQGAVNTMTTDQFFGKAGNPTVYFGRVPAQGKGAAPAPTATQKGGAARPAAPTPTPAKPSPAATFKFVGTPLDATDRGDLNAAYLAVKNAGNDVAKQRGMAALRALSAELKQAGYREEDIQAYLKQLAGR